MTQSQENTSHEKLPRNPSNPKTRTEGDQRFGTASEEENESEINPEKLEKSELETDVEGATGQKGHEPYEF